MQDAEIALLALDLRQIAKGGSGYYVTYTQAQRLKQAADALVLLGGDVVERLVNGERVKP